MRGEIRLIAPVIVPALFATLTVTLPVSFARAANGCVAAPTGEAPAGSHWYYRTDRATQRKCWYVSSQDRKVVRTRDVDTVGDGQSASSAGTAAESGPADDALTRRECDIELSVLNYRKILAGVFPTEAQGKDADAHAGELVAKQCRK